MHGNSERSSDDGSPSVIERAQLPSPEKQAEREEEEVHEKRAASAHIVYRAILDEGDEELKRPTVALAFSGLAAGLSMGFSLVAEGVLRSHLPHTPWQPLIAKLGYSVGFLIVILGRQQLFTENTLTPIIPLLHEKKLSTLVHVLRLWVTVLVANLVGACAFAFVVYRSNAFSDEAKAAFLACGRETMDPDVGTLLLRAIFAGWLIALMVWLLPVAETARVSVIIIVTYIVGIGQLSHVIAGSVDGMYTVFAGVHSWGDYFLRYLVPVLLGNILGGGLLVAVLNYAQVVAGTGQSGDS